MTNLSIKDIKNLDTGVSEGEITQYKKEGLLDLALGLVAVSDSIEKKSNAIEKAEFEKNEEDQKQYHPETYEAVKLIRQLKEEKNSNINKVKKELEKRIREKKEKRPKPMSERKK